MTCFRFSAAAMLCAWLGLLTACTNSRQDVNAFSFARTLYDAILTQSQDPVPPDPRVVERIVTQALSETDEPLALLIFEKSKSVALLRQIETNGPYRTWASFGTSERRSVTTRDGVVTSTRGLGFDLMSSSVNGLLSMVAERKDGIESQVLRHLNGEYSIDQTVAFCAFTPGQTETYALGELRQKATRVDVFCKTDSGRFTNYYLVNRSGRILEAHQWLGPDLGFGTLRQLR